MLCPSCKQKLKCTDSRQRPGNVRIRLYECKNCDYRGSSSERLEFEKLKRLKIK